MDVKADVGTHRLVALVQFGLDGFLRVSDKDSLPIWDYERGYGTLSCTLPFCARSRTPKSEYYVLHCAKPICDEKSTVPRHS